MKEKGRRRKREEEGEEEVEDERDGEVEKATGLCLFSGATATCY